MLASLDHGRTSRPLLLIHDAMKLPTVFQPLVFQY